MGTTIGDQESDRMRQQYQSEHEAAIKYNGETSHSIIENEEIKKQLGLRLPLRMKNVVATTEKSIEELQGGWRIMC